MSSDIIKKIITLICDRYGMKESPQQIKFLENSIKLFIEKNQVKSEIDLLKEIEYGKSSCYKSFVNSITVQESYFFRDQSLFNFLREIVLPQLMEMKLQSNNKKISIWSAGCSAGQEIYSIAIMLQKILPDIASWKLNLLGTDINTNAIELAKTGVYSKFSLRTLSENDSQKWFYSENGCYRLKDNIDRMVDFKFQNLASDDYPHQRFDIILCRNVFIYLSMGAINKILNQFEGCLNEDGYLFIGASDFISNFKNPLRAYFRNGVTYFKNQNESEIEQEHYGEKLGSSDVFSLNDDIKNEHHQEESFKDRNILESESIREIKEIIDKKQYISGLKAIDKYIDQFGKNIFIMRMKITALVGLSDIDTALETCELALTIDTVDAKILFIKGMLELDLKKFDAAKKSFQQAIFHEPNYPEVHYHLGLLLLRNGEKKAGQNELEIALKLSEKKMPLDQVEYAEDGVNFQQLKEAIQESLSMYREER